MLNSVSTVLENPALELELHVGKAAERRGAVLPLDTRVLLGVSSALTVLGTTWAGVPWPLLPALLRSQCTGTGRDE